MDYAQLLALLGELPKSGISSDPVRLLFGTVTAPLFGLGALGGLYLPSLLHLSRLKREVETRLDLTARLADGREIARSPMHWRGDRLAGSSHEAALPYGGVAREADHAFLGVEPWARFPVLLALELLLEHIYITGQSGSGKTSKPKTSACG